MNKFYLFYQSLLFLIILCGCASTSSPLTQPTENMVHRTAVSGKPIAIIKQCVRPYDLKFTNRNKVNFRIIRQWYQTIDNIGECNESVIGSFFSTSSNSNILKVVNGVVTTDEQACLQAKTDLISSVKKTIQEVSEWKKTNGAYCATVESEDVFDILHDRFTKEKDEIEKLDNKLFGRK